jgi:hypothetical protein
MTKRPTKKTNRRAKKKRVRRKGELYEKIMAIARASKQRLEETHQTLGDCEWLYDENGLPK